MTEAESRVIEGAGAGLAVGGGLDLIIIFTVGRLGIPELVMIALTFGSIGAVVAAVRRKRVSK